MAELCLLSIQTHLSFNFQKKKRKKKIHCNATAPINTQHWDQAVENAQI